MRRSFRFRAGLLLTLGLLTALPPLATQAAAPDTAAPEPLSAVADLLSGASGALSSLGETIDTTAQTVVDTVSPAAGPCSGFGNLDYGNDGRLTILLLGSDYRTKRYIGERMDTIIVATRKSNGRVAMASIPRDMVYFPKAGGGTSGTNRVNTMYYTYKRNKGNLDRRGLPGAQEVHQGRRGRAEDRDRLLRDGAHEHVHQPRRSRGLRRGGRAGADRGHLLRPPGSLLPGQERLSTRGQRRLQEAAVRVPLGARVRAQPARHPGGRRNNDFKRAYRQHDFIFDAAQRVRSRGNGAALSDLMQAITPKVWTNVPKNLNVARDIYNLIGGLSMSGSDRVVLGPSAYATSKGAPQYAFRPKLKAIRNWINDALRVLRATPAAPMSRLRITADRLLDGTGAPRPRRGRRGAGGGRRHRRGRPGRRRCRHRRTRDVARSRAPPSCPASSTSTSTCASRAAPRWWTTPGRARTRSSSSGASGRRSGCCAPGSPPSSTAAGAAGPGCGSGMRSRPGWGSARGSCRSGRPITPHPGSLLVLGRRGGRRGGGAGGRRPAAR